MDVVINIIHTMGEFAEILAFIICFDFLEISKKSKMGISRFVLSIIAFIVLTVTALYFNGNSFGFSAFIATIIYAAKYIFALFIICGQMNLKMIYVAILIDQIISFVSECLSCFSANFFDIALEKSDPFVTLFTRIISLSVLLILKKKTDSQKTTTVLKLIPKQIYVLLALSVVCLNALTSLIIFNTDDAKTKESLLIVIIIILSVILACIVVSLILNVIAKQHFTTVSQMMEKQVELQISHYEELEKMDAEMRRFRHDYTNHLQSILSLIQMKEYSDAKEYIEKIQKNTYRSATVMFYSGNKLADAILADKSAALDEHCRIEYSGIMPNSIENVELCIILSNSLDNAIEACREIHSPCTISVFAGLQQGYFVMSIKNPTVRSDSFYNIPQTTKTEKEQHGLGLYNIESAVKKYNGQMKIKCENGVFELMITMKL